MTINNLTQENLDWMQKNLLEWKSEYENKEVERHKREIAQAVL